MTDEDAFRALRERGIPIVVREQAAPAARCALRDPGEVSKFLQMILEIETGGAPRA